MVNISATIEEYARQCELQRKFENSFIRGCLVSVRRQWRINNMPYAEKGHIQRAAVRSFGNKYELVDFDTVRYEGREYHYNFKTGRFYGYAAASS